MCGDFNVVSNSIDKNDNLFNDSSRKCFLSMINNNSIHDVWRESHPNTIEFTWRQMRQSKLHQSRIDKILVSREFIYYVKSSTIDPFPWSDHDLVYVSIDLTEVAHGEGSWHFNNSLLSNDDYCQSIIATIDLMKCKSDYNKDFLIWYEDLKTQFKSISCRFGKMIAKEKHKKRKDLTKRVKNEYRKAALFNDYDLSLCKDLELQLQNFIVDDCQGAITRAKI